MQDNSTNHLYSRRTFLRTAGLAAGAVAVGRLTTVDKVQAAAITSGNGKFAASSLSIGVLLPTSTLAPDLAQQYLGGLQLALASTGAGQLLTQPIGRAHGSTRRQAASLLDAGVDVLLGFLTPVMATRLGDLLQAKQAVLLATSLGENQPFGQPHPAIFHHSLHQWQASYALGQWAARNIGRQAVIASHFHDSGYDSLAAFQAGFVATGGDVSETIVTHGPNAAHDVAYLLRRVGALRPDFVYASYAGAAAHEVVQAYAHTGYPPLLGGGFLSDAALLASSDKAALGIISAAAWSPQLDTTANRTFTTAYQAQHGVAPTSIALLGYETGLLLNRALATNGGDGRAASLASAIAAASFDSPRGQVTMNAKTHTTNGAVYRREVRWQAGAALNTIVEQMPTANVTLADSITMRSGWLEAYLSI